MRTSLNHTPFDISSKSFVSARSDKTNIVLHGSLSRTKYSYTSEQNSENYLMKTWGLLGDKVAGHYVVGRSGEIFSCFDEDYWSNHLGPDKRVSSLNKSSISIYLCNELYLENENSRYYALKDQFLNINSKDTTTGQITAKSKWRAWFYCLKIYALAGISRPPCLKILRG
jgi:N-acetyl-anhydromuramyl-L-alanine amidase AmpD